MFTYLWFARDEIEQIDLSRHHMMHQWPELYRILVRMVHEEQGPKQPNPKICRYCPYYNTECFPTECFPFQEGPSCVGPGSDVDGSSDVLA